jgi:hypothetical protein
MPGGAKNPCDAVSPRPTPGDDLRGCAERSQHNQAPGDAD